MNTLEFSEMLKKKPDCTVVAMMGSVLQINCVNAVILYLMQNGVKINGYVFRVTTETLKKETYDHNYQLQVDGLEYIDGKDDISWTSLHERADVIEKALSDKSNKNSGNVVYLIGADFIHPLYSSIKKAYGNEKCVVYVETDDGLSNYLPRLCAKFYNEIHIYELLKHLPKEIIKLMYYETILGILKIKRNYLNLCLLKKKGGKIYPNERIVIVWHKILQTYGIYDDLVHLSRTGQYVLIIGKQEDSVEDIEGIVEMCVNNNLRALYKPHPRDGHISRFDNAGCEILKNQNVSLEVMLENAKQKPFCVIGYGSSVHLYAYPLFGVKAYGCEDCIKEKEQTILETLNYKLYKRTVAGCVSFPKSLGELAGDWSV